MVIFIAGEHFCKCLRTKISSIVVSRPSTLRDGLMMLKLASTWIVYSIQLAAGRIAGFSGVTDSPN